MNWLIVEDLPILKDTLLNHFSMRFEEIHFLTANNCIEALEIMKKKQIHILFSDISMDGMDGLELAEIVKRERPKTKIILYTQYKDIDKVSKALAIEVDAYILKTSGFPELFKIIDTVLAGETFFDSKALKELELHKSILERLSERQLQIVKLLCLGKSASEIAKELNISEGTVKTHRSKVYETLGFNHITKLTSWAIKHNVI